MKKIVALAITSLLLITALYVVPSTCANNIEYICNKARDNTIGSLGVELVPEEYLNQFNGLLESIIEEDGESFEDQLIDLYVGIDDFQGVSVDLAEIYGSDYTDQLDILFGIKQKNSFDGDSDDPMEVINDKRKDVLSDNNKPEYIQRLEKAKEMDITYDDFLDDSKAFPEDFDAESYATQIEQIIYSNSAMTKLSAFVLDKINNEEEEDPLDLLMVILWTLWILGWTGFSFLPGFNLVTGVVGMVVSIFVGAAVSLALDEIQVTDGIADRIRGLFPESNPMSTIDYEGAISFIIGGIVFTSYILGFTGTRVVKFLTGATVAIAGLVAIYVIIEELKKQRDKSNVVKSNILDLIIFKSILLKCFQRFAFLQKLLTGSY